MKAILALSAGVLACGLALSFTSPAEPAAPAPSGEAVTYEIDPGHSNVIFKVRHLQVANFYGRFNEVTGQVTWDEANPAASSIRVEIPAESIDSNSEGRDKHLKSPDFLSAKEFPVLSFESTGIAARGDGLEVTGKMTVHGVTKEITFPAEHIGSGPDPWGGQRVGFDATVEIDPRDFDIKYMADDKMLGPGLTLMIGLECVKK